MRQFKINISYIAKYIFLFILLIPFMGISNFQRISQLDHFGFLNNVINKLWYINVMIIIAYAAYFFLYTRKFLSVSCFLIICIFFYLLLRTLLGGGSGYRNIITFILLSLFGEICLLKKRENFLIFVDTINMFIIINFVFIVRYIGQGGLVYWSVREQRTWKGYYLLGYDNGFIIIILPLICFSLILYRETGRKKYIIILVIQILSEVLVKSAAALIALICFGVFTLLQNNKLFIKIFYKPWNILFLYFACFYGFVVLKVQYVINSVIYFLFKKGLDTTRWRLWNEGLEKAEKSWIFGYGYRTEIFGKNYLTPHNMFLEWLTQGGIIEFFGYFVLIYLTLKQLNKHIETYQAKVLFNGIIAFMFAYMAEGYSMYMSYWLFLIVLLLSSRLGNLRYLFNCKQLNVSVEK